MPAKRSCLAMVLLAALQVPGSVSAQMTTRDLLALPRPAPDSIIAYGSDSLQVGELFLPQRSAKSRPVAVLIHGGCWLAAFDRGHLRQLARSIADRGIVVWSLEYRRVGNPGGGWPGSFEDIAAGVDYLRALAPGLDLDTNRVLVAGHSAGGHLALWVASRGRLTSDMPGATTPLRPRAVLALAAVPDLAEAASSPEPVCGDAIVRFMGGTPVEHPERYRAGSPARQAPLGIRQVLLTGEADRIVPADLSRRYAAKAKKAGDRVRLIVVPNAGHFEVVAPETAPGATVVRLIVELTR